ncbi:LETM1 and EF-hand domain-containing protein 1 [Hibiscus syriacus]|uniref:LETM1 and EF-hand domain-containing protein 1 n=1 Tax=Hibiscus syriacus TaxID=106335 RepID=A0A6A3BVR3_HIBSY|nr:LETM1 and EF-hand domain-containing protein 1 [Hibiscus syriacus]
MAQPGEIPINPPLASASQIEAQSPYPVQSQHPPRKDILSTAKRRREEEDPTAAYDTGESAPKRQAKSQDVIFRIVVPSKQIGKVIGKGGHRIQKIRENTKANIKIADAVVEDDGSTEAARVGAVGAGHVAANTIRLLIAGSQAGSLIGMSGQNIENLRSSSGASITILAPNQLPLCASAHESDRVVQISGDFPAVLKALAEIAYQLRENPPRQVISISPAYNFNLLRPAPPQPFVDPTSADFVTFEMVVSETYIGGLIGRCGSNISRIRIESGATIKVYGGKGEQNVRHIQFSGSSQQLVGWVRPCCHTLRKVFDSSWLGSFVFFEQRNMEHIMYLAVHGDLKLIGTALMLFKILKGPKYFKSSL